MYKIGLFVFSKSETDGETEDQEDGVGDQAAGGEDSDEDEYRPVQGPINKEPDEKLYPGSRKESGIRKL